MATVYYAFDAGTGDASLVRAASFANSEAREAAFRAVLGAQVSSTESFESITIGTLTPIALNFGAFGTATLNGIGFVDGFAGGATNLVGRYAHAVSGGRYFDTASLFSITFSRTLTAIGFYAIDLGDFGGSLTLEFKRNGAQVDFLTVPHSVGGGGAAPEGGSMAYVGVTTTVQFDEVVFGNTLGGFDVFGFDDFIVGGDVELPYADVPASCVGLVPQGPSQSCGITVPVVASTVYSIVSQSYTGATSTCGHSLMNNPATGSQC